MALKAAKHHAIHNARMHAPLGHDQLPDMTQRARQVTRLPFDAPFVSSQVRWAPQASAASWADCCIGVGTDP